MTISEQSRHAMYVKLEGALGQEAALILMEHLPPVGWADVATKRDLDHLHILTRADLDQLRGDMSQLGADLRGDMSQLGADLRGEMSQLGADLRGEMSQLSERMFDRMAAQTRTVVFSVMGSAVSVAALTMTAVRIG